MRWLLGWEKPNWTNRSWLSIQMKRIPFGFGRHLSFFLLEIIVQVWQWTNTAFRIRIWGEIKRNWLIFVFLCGRFRWARMQMISARVSTGQSIWYAILASSWNWVTGPGMAPKGTHPGSHRMRAQCRGCAADVLLMCSMRSSVAIWPRSEEARVHTRPHLACFFNLLEREATRPIRSQ
jgi:hypothetical protein